MTGEPQRLSKQVASQMPCSRREAEQYIAEGWVSVDGVVVREPQFRVGPTQRVTVDAKAKLGPVAPATFLLHKTAGALRGDAQLDFGAAAQWTGDSSGIRRVESHGAGLRELLPLPSFATGLVVVSQDGRIVRKLTEDAALVEQELIADVEGAIADHGVSRLARGLVHAGRALPPARVSWQSEKRLRIAAKGLDPALVPWMCEQVGLRLAALRRLRIGRIAMAALPPGQWRYLRAEERF